MKTLIINDVRVKTNFEEKSSYLLCDGNNKKGYVMKIPISSRETQKEMLERLVKLGYTRILFRHVSSSIRGYHTLLAFVN